MLFFMKGECSMTNHQYGPKGYIVDAFFEHLKQMTEADEQAIIKQENAV